MYVHIFFFSLHIPLSLAGKEGHKILRYLYQYRYKAVDMDFFWHADVGGKKKKNRIRECCGEGKGLGAWHAEPVTAGCGRDLCRCLKLKWGCWTIPFCLSAFLSFFLLVRPSSSSTLSGPTHTYIHFFIVSTVL